MGLKFSEGGGGCFSEKTAVWACKVRGRARLVDEKVSRPFVSVSSCGDFLRFFHFVGVMGRGVPPMVRINAYFLFIFFSSYR